LESAGIGGTIEGQDSGSGGMKLGKLFGLIGFVVGFIGPFFFYSVPSTFRSHLACPVCAYSNVTFKHPLFWPAIGLSGLIQGVIYALLALGIGYSILKIKHST
jgi:hypothetical protein